MSYECFDLTVAEGIAHIRFNRPEKANSMIPSFWTELPDAVNALSREAEARVIVLSAEGRHFSSGMDIAVFMDGGLDGADSDSRFVRAEAFRHHCMALQDAFSCLEAARMPVLVAIQGAAVGGAMDLITACDCRYATKDAFFSVHETAIGMTADVGTYPRLVKLIPEGWARQMSYTAERVSADKAREIGLVNEVYDTAEEMLEAVMTLLSRLPGTRRLPCRVLSVWSIMPAITPQLTVLIISPPGMRRCSMVRPSALLIWLRLRARSLSTTPYCLSKKPRVNKKAAANNKKPASTQGGLTN